MFSGFSKFFNDLGQNFLNASSVGAKTVKGPSPLRVSTRSAFRTAATSVQKLPASIAESTMSFLGAAESNEAIKSKEVKVSAFFIVDV